MSLSNSNSYFIKVRSVGSSFQFTRFRHSLGIMEKEIRCTLARLSRRHVAVGITVVVGRYDIQNLQVGFTVQTMSLTYRGNSSGLASETTHLWGILVQFIILPILGKKKLRVNVFQPGLEVVPVAGLPNKSYGGRSRC